MEPKRKFRLWEYMLRAWNDMSDSDKKVTILAGIIPLLFAACTALARIPQSCESARDTERFVYEAATKGELGAGNLGQAIFDRKKACNED